MNVSMLIFIGSYLMVSFGEKAKVKKAGNLN